MQRKRERVWLASPWAWVGLALSASLATACSRTAPPTPEVTTVNRRVALQQFEGSNACAELEAYIEDTAVSLMRARLSESRDDNLFYARNRNNWFGGGDVVFAESADASGASPPMAQNAPSNAAPTDFTTTNNQEQAVDEADIIKNDGTRLFALAGGKLRAVKTWPANELGLLGTLTLAGQPRELFLHGADRVVVFSQLGGSGYYGGCNGACDAISLPGGGGAGGDGQHAVRVSIIDVSNMRAMRLLSSYDVPGNYVSARKIGESVRIVVTSRFNFPQETEWYPDYSAQSWEMFWSDEAAIASAYDGMMARNEQLIRAQSLGAWVPVARYSEGSTQGEFPRDCGQYARNTAPTELGFVTVATLDLATSGFDQTSIVAAPAEVYASERSLYLASRHWWSSPAPGQSDATYLHKFDISSPAAAVYVASGTVDGQIVDQFSMDEGADGSFRIVTTITTREQQSDEGRWWNFSTKNRLSVLAEAQGALDVIGQSPDLAPGERVMSSRILGNRGFVVTFRQVDPLFTFDLTNPRNPILLGELKIPGFSTYLHPLDETHLLTIGTYVPEPTGGENDWRARALQLAIFDVSDMRNPVQTHTQLVGTAYGWSEAQSNHKAFNYFAARKTLAIPFSDYSWGAQSDNDYWSRFTSQLRVFNVDAQAGFSAVGNIDLGDMYRESGSGYGYSWSYWWQPDVRRSIMADDYIYAIGDAGVRVVHRDDTATAVATAKFD